MSASTLVNDTAARRRTQAERSDAMRRRILDATIDCLQAYGYAGTTMSRVVDAAGVSRGAPLHHFPSKALLITAAAERLVRRVYGQLGEAVAQIQHSDDRVHDLLSSAWENILKRPEYVALQEILVVSQREPELAKIIQKVWAAVYSTITNAAEHYLESVREGSEVREMMLLTQWLLRGMAEDLHIVNDSKRLDYYLKLWCSMLAPHLQARANVAQTPPRPPHWDSSWSKS